MTHNSIACCKNAIIYLSHILEFGPGRRVTPSAPGGLESTGPSTAVGRVDHQRQGRALADGDEAEARDLQQRLGSAQARETSLGVA